MKKLILTAILACVCLQMHAQREAAYADNTFFLSFNAGATYYQHSGTGQLGIPSAGVYFGRWLMRPLAFRLAVDHINAPAYAANSAANANHILGSAEFMWDVNSTFFHVYNKTFQYPCPIYPLIGLGLIYRLPGDDFGADRDVQAMLGFQLPVRISLLWDMALEYKLFFLPQRFDESNGDNYMHTITLGLTRRWSDDPFRRRTAFESRNTGEDWFTGFGVGALFNSFDFAHMFDGEGKLWNITGDMMVGRNYSNIWTIRFELSGFFARERYDDETETAGLWYTFNSLHTDFMINLSHLTSFRNGQKWNFLPYLGAGPIWRYRNSVFTLSADAGILFRRYIDNMGDFFVDVKYIAVPPRFTGNPGDIRGYLSVGFPMITVGYICNWGHSTTRYRMPVNSCSD